MKVLVLVLAAVCLLLQVSSESCSHEDASSCDSITCVDGTQTACIGGICTCAEHCKSKEELGGCRHDCHKRHEDGHLSCVCPSKDLHCIDGECHCVHF